mmetsp:Transcript_36177/g.75997  ORF Transcript_36177/g.75997 Transcript_36177/m.75997 type:complete len:239 (-) Transcript_36177:61-777(-)
MRRIAITKIAILNAPHSSIRIAYTGCLYHTGDGRGSLHFVGSSGRNCSLVVSSAAVSKSISSILAAMSAKERVWTLLFAVITEAFSPFFRICSVGTSFTSTSSLGAGAFPQQSRLKFDNILSTASALSSVFLCSSEILAAASASFTACSSSSFSCFIFFLCAKAASRLSGTRPHGSQTLSIKSFPPAFCSSPAVDAPVTGAFSSAIVFLFLTQILMHTNVFMFFSHALKTTTIIKKMM